MKIKTKGFIGKTFRTYEEALEAAKIKTNFRNIEVIMDLEDFHQMRCVAGKKIEEAEKKITEAERKQNEFIKVVKKEIEDAFREKIEEERASNERILKTLRRVRKEKKLKPKEIEKEKLIKAEFLAKREKKKEKYLEHWLMPVPPEPELVEVARKWIESKEWQEYTEKIYLQPNLGWIAVIHVGEAFLKEVRYREKEQVRDREEERVRIWEEGGVQFRQVYRNTNTERGREEELYSRDTY